MATTKETKKAFAVALKELLACMSFEQIRVGDICERSGRNRKSFYYHFKDKYDLVCWIFDSELVTKLREAVLLEDISFDEAALRVVTYFYQNRGFYRKLMQVSGQNSFGEHFGGIVRGFLSELMGVPENDGAAQKFCIEFYADAVLQSLGKWLSRSPTLPPEVYLDYLKTSLHSFPKNEGGDMTYWE